MKDLDLGVWIMGFTCAAAVLMVAIAGVTQVYTPNPSVECVKVGGRWQTETWGPGFCARKD